MTVILFLAAITLALMLGWKLCDCSNSQSRMVEAFHRDMDVADAADICETGCDDMAVLDA